jgi:ribonucleotide monophosphatase NagD (HAD superfamily)
MIGDNPVNDIRGARDTIQALTLQKIHDGVALGVGENRPDASFQDFQEVRQFIQQLSHA